MKFLFDFFPLILFFLVYKVAGGHEEAAHAIAQQYLNSVVSGGSVATGQAPILLATAVGIIATVLQVGYLLVRGRKVDGMLWVTLAVIGGMGSATIYFHDEVFIKWKPTILYWVFALAFFVAQVFFRKNMVRAVMGQTIQLPDEVWKRLVYAWMLCFVALGFLNLLMAFVVFKADTAAWVNFKVFGMTGIFFLFIVGQTFFLAKYIKEEEA